jgi:hypothetical protein
MPHAPGDAREAIQGPPSALVVSWWRAEARVMTIVGAAHDLRHRIEAATHPKDWADVVLRLRVLARRLAVESRTRRPTKGTVRDLGRLVAALEAARVPSDWRGEIDFLAVAIATAAGFPFAGPKSGESGLKDPPRLPPA